MPFSVVGRSFLWGRLIFSLIGGGGGVAVGVVSGAGSLILIFGTLCFSSLSLLRFFFFLLTRSCPLGGALIVSFGTFGAVKHGSEAMSSSTTDLHMAFVSTLASTGTGL